MRKEHYIKMDKYNEIKDAISAVLERNSTLSADQLKGICAQIIDEEFAYRNKTKEAELKIARDEVLDALNFWAETLKSWGIEVKIDPDNFLTAMKEAEAGPKFKKTREEIKKPSADSIIDEYLKKYKKNRELQF